MRWKLYYADESTFSEDGGTWADAPHRGALILATAEPEVGRELDHGARGEFFAWWPGASKPWGFDRVGILDYLVEVGFSTATRLADLSLDDWQEAGVKIGQNVDNDVYRRVVQAAIQDEDLPMKSARSLRESVE